jgi:hypothetical protein
MVAAPPVLALMVADSHGRSTLSREHTEIELEAQLREAIAAGTLA